jgi:antitoxin ParD1/3/4
MIEFAIQIPDDLKPFIDQSVKSGLFSDVEDFVVNVLYSARAQSEAELPEDQKARLAALRAEIAIGIEQADRGDFVEFTAEDVIAAGRARRAAAA